MSYRPVWPKRAFDLTAGTVLCIGAAPLILGLAVALAVSLRAWPFFVQDRVGRNGKLFRFWKLRTLPRSAPAYTDKYAVAQLQIPRLARILRAKHLDELPQLFLVVAGKMSLVGPRPEMPYLHKAANTDFATARTSVRPGCTGLWQASTANNGLIWDAPEYDRYYLRHVGGGFDLWILWRTALSMANLAQPIMLGDVPEFVQNGRAAPWQYEPVEAKSLQAAN